MTLLDVIPSLRASLPPSLPPHLWPATTARAERGKIVVGGTSLAGLAEQFGTPLYVLDEQDVRARCRQYTAAFGTAADVAYAAKALTCRAVLRWVAEEGLSLSVCSAGRHDEAGDVILRDAPLPGDLRTSAAPHQRVIMVCAATFRTISAAQTMITSPRRHRHRADRARAGV